MQGLSRIARFGITMQLSTFENHFSFPDPGRTLRCRNEKTWHCVGESKAYA